MNNKLRHFPDFASTTGLAKVSNCADARLFAQRYSDYLDAFPSFDRDEPIEPDSLPKVARPHVTEAEVLAAAGVAQKQKNGSGDRLSPVVRLRHMVCKTTSGCSADESEYNFGKYCTGSFIGRNWIMTAAHCLQTARGWDVTQGPDKAKIHAWYKFRVIFFTAQGVWDGAKHDYHYVLQYMDPRFVGFERSSNLHPFSFDFALLYIIDSLDNGLPNNDPNLSLSTAPFLRVSLSSTVNTSQSQFWGAGDQGVTPEPNPPQLFRGSLVPYQSTFNSEVEKDPLLEQPGRIYTADVPSASAAYICEGDSGGPIVDRFDIKNPTTGEVEPQYVAQGVLSGSHQADVTRDCADQSSTDWVAWVPTNDEREFVQSWVSDWYGYFHCKRALREGSSVDEYLECWGKPCKDDTVCKDSEFCHHPGSELKLCSCPGGGCDCMYGQCMPKDN
jgi:hypothetical protein